MTHPRLETLLVAMLVASLISFGLPWMAGSVGRIRIGVSIATLIVAFCMTVLAIVVHRKRGLWVILAAVPALFWPAVVISFVAACSINGDCD
jgi:succinate dehydrogenase hydrophobic anchor subunit